MLLLGIVFLLLINRTLLRRMIVALSEHLTLVFLICIVLSFLARLGFVFFRVELTSDPANNFATAKSLVEAGALNNGQSSYIALFPHLLSYDLLLAGAMNLTGVNHFSVILLNTILDSLSCLFVYTLVKDIADRRAGLVAAILWMLSPFNIAFATLPLPVSAVNTAIFSVFLVLRLTIRKLDERKICQTLLLGLTTGTLLAIANVLRPIMIVFVIAIFMFLTLRTVRAANRSVILTMALFLLILSSYMLVGEGYMYLVADITDCSIPQNTAGWNIYVGSNYVHWGAWNAADSEYLSEVLQETNDSSQAFNRLSQEGIQRYRELSPLHLVDFFCKKSIRLGGVQWETLYNLSAYPDFWGKEWIRTTVQMSCAVYAFGAFVVLIKSLLQIFRNRSSLLAGSQDFLLILLLIFVGVFCANLLVEVSPRYFMPLWTTIIPFVAIWIRTRLACISDQNKQTAVYE